MMKRVNCIILAGGKSSRMTFNKELIKIGGEYLVHRNINKLGECFDEIIIISNYSSHYKNLNVKVFRDLFYRMGPMAGLHSGLVHSDTPFSFLIACDMPNINLKLIRFLVEKIDKNYDGVVCLDKNGEISPMYGIYKNELKNELQKYLVKGFRKIQTFIKEHNFRIIKFDNYKTLLDKNVFENLNTLSELSEFIRQIKE